MYTSLVVELKNPAEYFLQSGRTLVGVGHHSYTSTQWEKANEQSTSIILDQLRCKQPNRQYVFAIDKRCSSQEENCT